MDIEKLISLYPRLFHMAEQGTWDSISTSGLMSTSAVLDHYGIQGDDRLPYESQQRREKINVTGTSTGHITLRDQKPMPRARLLDALRDNISPEEWYYTLNQKVFLWTEEQRLHRLLGARYYRHLEHDVLTVDTAKFVHAYANKIWLCPMNSGNTWPMPHARGAGTFSRIPDYPVKPSGLPVKPIVELVVDYQVKDIRDFVIEVRRMKGTHVIKKIL